VAVRVKMEMEGKKVVVLVGEEVIMEVKIKVAKMVVESHKMAKMVIMEVVPVVTRTMVVMVTTCK
jgi:hypothetical protein